MRLAQDSLPLSPLHTMPYLERSNDDVRLFYQTRGKGPALVLINGLSQSVANWITQASALSEGFQVIMYDGRGQGRSSLGDRALNLTVHTDDLRALLDHLQISKAYVVGFSHGARIALHFAARFPERVAKLALAGQGADDSVHRRILLRVWREVLRNGGTEALAWCSLIHILSPAYLELHHEQLDVMIRTTVQRNSDAGLAAMLDGLLAYPSAIDDARRVQCPTLVCSADLDPLCSEKSARSLSNQIEDVRHVHFSNCGHTIPIEQPHRWRTEVEAFWARPASARLSSSSMIG